MPKRIPFWTKTHTPSLFLPTPLVWFLLSPLHFLFSMFFAPSAFLCFFLSPPPIHPSPLLLPLLYIFFSARSCASPIPLPISFAFHFPHSFALFCPLPALIWILHPIFSFLPTHPCRSPPLPPPHTTRAVISLDGWDRAIVMAESLARVIAAIRVTSVHWRSYLPPIDRK